VGQDPGERPLRCAYCHDRVAGRDALACDACWTHLHPACAEELGRCPTLGCRGAGWAPSKRVRWEELVRAAAPWLALGEVLDAAGAWGPTEPGLSSP